MAYARLCLLVLLGLVVQSIQQDPIVDLCGALLQNAITLSLMQCSCRRWDHQTAQVGSKLYIDGGMVTYNQQAQNYTSTSCRRRCLSAQAVLT